MVPHSSFGRAPPYMTPFGRPRSVSDPAVLQAAVEATQHFFADKQTPLIVLGRRARCAFLGFGGGGGRESMH